MQTFATLLVQTLASGPRMRAFARGFDDGEDIVANLPEGAVTPADLALALADQLKGRGLIDIPLFRRLLSLAPGFRDSTIATARALGLPADSDLVPFTVLMVDDEPDTTRAIQRALRAAGFNVRLAQSVEDALGVLRNVPVDLVLTDILLPDGLGTTLAGHIADAHPGVHCIAYSGYATPSELPGDAGEHWDPRIGWLYRGAGVPSFLDTVSARLRGPEPPAPGPSPSAAPTGRMNLDELVVDAKRLGADLAALRDAVAAKMRSHPRLFTSDRAYVEVVCGNFVVYLLVHDGVAWGRRVFRVPSDADGSEWLDLYAAYADFCRRPHRDPSRASQLRFEESVRRAIRELQALAVDVLHYASHHPEVHVARRLRQHLALLERTADQDDVGTVVLESEVVLSGIHATLDALRPSTV